jgi:polysaccharide biosynthesis/export protein
MRIQSTIWASRQALILLILAALPGCMPPPAALTFGPTPRAQLANVPESPAQNLERLAALTAERRVQSHGSDYLLGGGDLLAVSAVGLDTLTQKVRIDGDGNVTLPLLGAVPVADKTVADVQRDLTARLGEFMFDAHVNVFVEEYRSQQVAVVGAVQHPGVVALPMASPTVLDALSAAGGMTAEAGGRVYLVPVKRRAEHGAAVVPAAFTAEGSVQNGNTEPPIMLEIKELGRAAETALFQLPVRGGDVMMVPAVGEFIVSGWVAKPGKYALQSTMTLRGAIATGGDLEFPADTSHVRIYRLTSNGDTETRIVDYRSIANGRTQDVFIHDGDVIEARASVVKIVPYAVYKFLTDIIRFGARVGIPL